MKEDLENQKKWEQAHDEGKMYEHKLQGTDKETEKEEEPRFSKDIWLVLMAWKLLILMMTHNMRIHWRQNSKHYKRQWKEK
eukprot:7263817-Ditylum_brightwellii.AAC.1